MALATLASRATWARELLTAIEEGRIPAKDLTAFTVRQLSAIGDEAIAARLNKVWGEVRKTPKDRAKKISKLKSWLTPDVIAQGDQAHGGELFKQQCGKCHRFFGEGGNIGPDITGAQRTNIDYLLENIVDPSASVSKDYRMQIIQTDDGRVITGLIESENERSVTIVTVDQKISIPVDEIETRKASSVSIMPDELLEKHERCRDSRPVCLSAKVASCRRLSELGIASRSLARIQHPLAELRRLDATTLQTSRTLP